MKKNRHFNTFIIQSIVVATLGIICFFLISSYYQKNQESLTIKIVNSNMLFTEQLLAEKGPIREKNGLLYAGDFLLNNSNEIVKAVKLKTGFGCTIFQGNKRISTTAVAEGESKSAIGTFANDEVSKLVFEEGQIFEGVTETIGKEWIILYKPMYDASNEIVGMIAIYEEYDLFWGGIWAFKLMVAIAMFVCCFIVIMIMRNAYKHVLKLDTQNEVIHSNAQIILEHQEELKKLSIIANEIDQCIAIIDKFDNIEWVNPAFIATFNYSIEEIIGNKVSSLLSGPKTDHSVVNILNEYIFKYKKAVDVNVVQYRKDGSSFWAKVLVSPILDDYGNLEKYITISHDITDEYEANAQLKIAKNQFSEIGRTIQDVFYLYNILEKKYEYISPHCKEILGVSDQDFYAGISNNKVQVWEDDKQVLTEVKSIVEKGAPYDIEFRIVMGSKIRWIRERSYPIFDDDGKVIKNSGLCTDITEQKNIKKNIEIANNDTRLLAEIGLEITECRTIEEIINNLYARVNELMDAFGFSIGIVDYKKNELKFPLFIESDKNYIDAIHKLDENVLACICVNTNQDIIIQDLERDYPKYSTAKLDFTGGDITYSIIYLPIVINKKTIGVLTVQSRDKNAYSNHHINLLKNLNAYLSNGIENILLNESLEEQVKSRTEEIVIHKNKLIEQYESNYTLSEIGVSLSSSLDIENIFDTLHGHVMKMMKAEMFGIRIINKEKNCVEYKYEIENSKRHNDIEVSLDNTNNFTIWSIDNQQSILINDNENEYIKYVEEIDTPAGETSQSLIFCPMIIDGVTLGVITVQSMDKNAYTKSHLSTFKTLAFYAAIALSNAELLNTLEIRVEERTSEVSKKNQEITDSIHYTKRIQSATLTSVDVRKSIFPESFVIYKPKDIISGDFFIINSINGSNNEKYKGFIVGDCTGHGVPGASLAILCSSMLDQTFSEPTVNTPAEALNFVRKRLQKLFNSSQTNTIADGMDVGFGVINESTNELFFSGALMDCLILRNKEWITIKGNRFHVGYSQELIPFIDHKLQLEKGDQIFLTSDGIIDQFGGENNKKFMRKRFLEVIENNTSISMDELGNKINERSVEWQGKAEQTDDICAVGIRI